MAQMRETEEENGSRDDVELSWTDSFHSKTENVFFCEVDYTYLKDQFSLFGLKADYKYYHYAMDLLRDEVMSTYKLMSSEQKEEIENETKIVYGAIHARFILTSKGLERMKIKYDRCDFGECSNRFCNKQPLLPIGFHSLLGMDCVHLYCSCCESVYRPKDEMCSNIDGGYFGPSFAHLFLLKYPMCKPMTKKNKNMEQKYMPTLYGYRLHSSWHKVAMNELSGNEMDINELKCNKNGQWSNDEKNVGNHLLNTVQNQSERILHLEKELKETENENRKLKKLNEKQRKIIESQKNLLKIHIKAGCKNDQDNDK